MNVSPFCCIKTISVTVRSSSGAKLEQSKTCQNGPWAHSSHTSDNQYGDSGPAEEESSGRLRESGISGRVAQIKNVIVLMAYFLHSDH